MSSGIEYYVLDTETTGLKVGHQEVIEISIIRCHDKVQLTRTIRALKPKNASFDALQITGKTMSDLNEGISKIQAVRDVNEFLERDGLTPLHRCIVAHNASFDKRFIHHMWEEQGQSFPADMWLDTVPFCKRLATKMGQPKAKTKLEMALDLFGIKKVGKLHSAKGDTRNTYMLWKHLMDSGVEYIDLIKQFPHRKSEEISDDEMQDLLFDE